MGRRIGDSTIINLGNSQDDRARLKGWGFAPRWRKPLPSPRQPRGGRFSFNVKIYSAQPLRETSGYEGRDGIAALQTALRELACER
jgi:hypothetical protein